MAAIGTGWVDGAWIEAAWVGAAWSDVERDAAVGLFPPSVVDAPARRWKVDAERTWEIDAPPRRFKVDDDL